MTSKAPPSGLEAAALRTAANDEASSLSPRFPSILVARSNKTRPSELEVLLRSHCGKMKVSPRLSGAHMILQNKDSSNIAVRCYYPMDVQRLEESQCSNETPLPPSQLQQHQQDIDGIQVFVRHFQWTVIFFVLPADHFNDQIQDDNSFLRQVMRLLDDTSLVEQQQQQQQQQPSQSSHHPMHQSKSFIKNPPRLVIRGTTEQAIDYLVSLTDALKPAKHKLRQEFFHRHDRLHFGPNAVSAVVVGSQKSSNDDKTALDRNAAAHAVTTFRQLADRLQLPPGEADLLLRLIGQNSTLVSLVDTVKNKNNSLPMEEQSKDILERFFGTTDSPGNEEGPPSGRIDPARGSGMNAPSSSNFGTDYQSMFPPQTILGNSINTLYSHPQFCQAQDQMVQHQQQQHGSERTFLGQNQLQQSGTQAPLWNEESQSGSYNYQQPNQVSMMLPQQAANIMPMQYGRPTSNYAMYNHYRHHQQQRQQHVVPPPHSDPSMIAGRFHRPPDLAPYHRHHPAAPFPPTSENTQYYAVARDGPFTGLGESYHRQYHHQSTMPYSQGPQ